MNMSTNILLNCKGATNKNDFREALRALCFDYDANKRKLSICGTNAQCMIVNTITIDNDDDDAFCKKYFMDRSAYFINEGILDAKEQPISTFDELDGRLILNGQLLVKFDSQYPNYNACIPHNNLTLASQYCAWNTDLIRQVDKAMGYKKGNSILDTRPLVNANEEKEYQNPHLWIIESDEITTQIVIMPLRLDI